MWRAITIEPGRLELQECTPPTPSPDEVQVRIEQVGICGSDLHIFSGHHPTATFPRVQGHEAGGIIESLPVGYDGPFAPGDRVAIDPILSCGVCYACRLGRGNACSQVRVIGAHLDGCLQTSIKVPAANVHSAEALSADQAALVEPISVGLQAIRRANLQSGENVVIFGAGPIGLCTAIAAIDAGAQVLMLDLVPQRLEVAANIGVQHVVHAGKTDLNSTVREWTSGDGPAVTIDAVGAPGVIRQCCDLVANAGRVVVVGLSDQEVTLPIAQFTYKEMTILGSRASAGLFGEAISLVGRQATRVSNLITHRFALSDTGTALAYVRDNPHDVIKLLIEVGG